MAPQAALPGYVARQQLRSRVRTRTRRARRLRARRARREPREHRRGCWRLCHCRVRRSRARACVLEEHPKHSQQQRAVQGQRDRHQRTRAYERDGPVHAAATTKRTVAAVWRRFAQRPPTRALLLLPQRQQGATAKRRRKHWHWRQRGHCRSRKRRPSSDAGGATMMRRAGYERAMAARRSLRWRRHQQRLRRSGAGWRCPTAQPRRRRRTAVTSHRRRHRGCGQGGRSCSGCRVASAATTRRS